MQEVRWRLRWRSPATRVTALLSTPMKPSMSMMLSSMAAAFARTNCLRSRGPPSSSFCFIITASVDTKSDDAVVSTTTLARRSASRTSVVVERRAKSERSSSVKTGSPSTPLDPPRSASGGIAHTTLPRDWATCAVRATSTAARTRFEANSPICRAGGAKHKVAHSCCARPPSAPDKML